MILNTLFISSGIVVAVLIRAKVLEDRNKSKPLFLRLISKWDEHLRNFSYDFAHSYSEFKNKFNFFLYKQLPLHIKSSINKLSGIVERNTNKYLGEIKGSKFLKKNEGISEFFKSISDKESANQIDPPLEAGGDSQESKTEVK